MADSDKNIIITPNRGATSQPSIAFTGQGNDPITIRVLDGTTGTGLTAGGALSFEGSAGQLFSVVNRLGTGSIFSVNDISGMPSIDVDASGTIELAPFTGYVGIGATLPGEKLDIIGNLRVNGNYIGNVVRNINGITAGVGISAGTNITITITGNTLTIAATGTIGSTGATGATGATGTVSGDYVIRVNGRTGGLTLAGQNGIFVDNSGTVGPTSSINFALVSGNLKTSTAAFSPLFKRGVTYGLITDFTNSNELFYYQGSTGLYGTLIGQNGLFLRGSSDTSFLTSGEYSSLFLPSSSISSPTISSPTKLVRIDYGSGSLLSGYTTGIIFSSYDGFDGFESTLSILAQNASNDYILPNDSGTIALLNPTKTQTFTSVLRAGSGLCASGGVTFSGPAEFDSLARFDAGLCASGGATFSGRAIFASGICAAGSSFTAINVVSGATSFSLLTLTGSSLADGVGILRLVGSEPDLNFNDTDGGFNTLTFENAGNARVAIGRNNNDAFYLAVRDPAVSGGAWKDNVIVANSSNGILQMGYGLCASGGVTFSGPVEFDSLARFDSGLCASGGATFGGGIISDAFILNSNGIKSLTGTTYTFLTSDSGKVLTFNNGSTITVTIPTALPIGFSCTAIQLGTGQVGFTRASGVTLNSYGNQFKLIGQHAAATITEYATDIVNISGNLIV